MYRKLIFVFFIFTLALSACASKTVEPDMLTIMTHDSFAISEEVVLAFEEAHDVKVVFLASGDAGSSLNKAILTKGAPLADLLFGVDNTFLSRALDAEIFESYDAPALAEIPAEFQLDSENRAIPVDFGDVCINYDKAYFAEHDLDLPASFEDLLKPEYAVLLVVENPATSSPGLAFLFATIAHFSEDGYLDYWQGLRDNGVIVADGWETAYYTHFSASSGQGPQPMVVSYGSSPAAEVIFAERELDDAPTASLLGENMCFRQIEFVGILTGTEKRELAEAFIDFMLSTEFQEDLPMQMFVYPVLPSANLPAEFVDYAEQPSTPATLDSALITENREQWIADWTQRVLK
ncbi:MAG: thiamine ABC transporter substrate-binding protein [Anaerolineae bacterium]|jgi:thiamine transport system substrate-binding protein|nr:thiamine ABC transporter substrate-binding protein [Anaerolineae bacterium]MBT7073591.1 thiamine ABC transporter substrate-binding protein [Anaerolineae bacterium]MBT7782134.1 thiamine ABC transporter substrate-binding protein [Anaerolineae bacterium]